MVSSLTHLFFSSLSFKGAHSSFRSESQRGQQMILSKGIPGPGSYNTSSTEEELRAKREQLEQLMAKTPVGGLRVLGKEMNLNFFFFFFFFF